MSEEFAVPESGVFAGIRKCKLCLSSNPPIPVTPRPIICGTSKSKIRIIGQAPGTRVHNSGIAFDDPSGDRLRDWLGVKRDVFYNEDIFAITPMGFCFPGLDKKGGDLPPRKECAPFWQPKLEGEFPNVELTLLVGMYAQKYYLPKRKYKTLTETVKNWREYAPDILPLPHPSWRNTGWIKKNPWFEEVTQYLNDRVATLLTLD